MDKIKIAAVVGPTASGKTALAAEIAKKFGGEVISADSMQIYKGLDIATAKPTAEEMQGIPHHLISVVEPHEEFSVADYVRLAKKCIEDISSRGKLPILAGGTGLYINSLIDNIDFTHIDSNGEARKRIEDEAEKVGSEALYERLKSIDPEGAASIHPNNITRVIRALEVCEVTGIKFSDYKQINNRKNESPYEAVLIGLNFKDRNILYDRINRRVDIMFENGLLQEAEEVFRKKDIKTIKQAIGYKELIPFFNNESTFEECAAKIKQETRHYAKRQLTWFRRDDRINWIYPDETVGFENIMRICEKHIVK